MGLCQCVCEREGGGERESSVAITGLVYYHSDRVI